MKHSNSFWKRTIIGCSLLGMVIVTALPAQAAVQATTLNEHTVSAVSTYTGTNAALATSKTAAINTATSTTNTTTNDATLTANKTTAKKAALNKTSLKLKKGKTYQLKTKNVKGTVTVVEGNYNSSIHWFRTITKSSLQQTGFSVDTRY